MHSKWYDGCWRNSSRGKGTRQMLLFGPEQVLACFRSECHSQVEIKTFPYGPVWKLLKISATAFPNSVAVSSCCPSTNNLMFSPLRCYPGMSSTFRSLVTTAVATTTCCESMTSPLQHPDTAGLQDIPAPPRPGPLSVLLWRLSAVLASCCCCNKEPRI